MDAILTTCKFLSGNAEALKEESCLHRRKFINLDHFRATLEANGGSLTFLGKAGYELNWRGEVHQFRLAKQLKTWATFYFEPEPLPGVSFRKIYSGYYAVHRNGDEVVGYIDSGRGEGAVGYRATYYLYEGDRELTAGTIQHCKKFAIQHWS
ncbi:MAG: hypothetical protein ACO29V_03335 [Limnohabitans sp.]